MKTILTINVGGGVLPTLISVLSTGLHPTMCSKFGMDISENSSCAFSSNYNDLQQLRARQGDGDRHPSIRTTFHESFNHFPNQLDQPCELPHPNCVHWWHPGQSDLSRHTQPSYDRSAPGTLGQRRRRWDLRRRISDRSSLRPARLLAEKEG